MSYKTDRAEFTATIIAEITAQPGGDTATARKVATRILNDAHTLQQIAIRACNGTLEAFDATNDKAAENRILRACKPWGIRPDFNGDPRGAVVKLRLPSGKWNSFGGPEDGYCVPTPDCHD